MSAQTAEEARNEQVIRKLYALADGKSKDTPQFVAQFAPGGYFYDVSAGKKYYGNEIGLTVDVYATAFPDMHRELYSLHTFGDIVLVNCSSTELTTAIPCYRREPFRPPERRSMRPAVTSSTGRTAKSLRSTATSRCQFCWSSLECS